MYPSRKRSGRPPSPLRSSKKLGDGDRGSPKALPLPTCCGGSDMLHRCVSVCLFSCFQINSSVVFKSQRRRAFRGKARYLSSERRVITTTTLGRLPPGRGIKWSRVRSPNAFKSLKNKWRTRTLPNNVQTLPVGAVHLFTLATGHTHHRINGDGT